MTVFVVVETNQDDLTHALLGVFGTLGAAKTRAGLRAAAEDVVAIAWAHREGSVFWRAEGGGFGWEISEHTIESAEGVRERIPTKEG